MEFMPEEFYQYVWQTGAFSIKELKTTQNEAIQIIHPGIKNTHAGPDFFNARVKIGETEWAGNVEVHILASDWFKHHHEIDEAYNQIILHVVCKNDCEVIRKDGSKVAILLLTDYLNPVLATNYKLLIENINWIPCEKMLNSIDSIYKTQMLHRTATERLEIKAMLIEQDVAYLNGDWETAFYRHTAKCFGFKTNAVPFGMLAKTIPHLILGKHKNNLHQIEAIVFGQAGMLNENLIDDYGISLLKEYKFLKQKYDLKGMDAFIWKFMRMRPVNFPTIRIAQFAWLVCNSAHLFSKILSDTSINQLKKLFKAETSDYWKEHFLFDKKTVFSEKNLGENSINSLLINAVAPFLFSYGRANNNDNLKDRAIEILEKTESESNSIVEKFESLGLQSVSSLESQGLLHLKEYYCNRKKCLHCTIGNSFLNFRQNK